MKNCISIVNILHQIEQVAIEQMKLPSEYHHSGSYGPVFKHFPSASNLYFKLSLDIFVIRPVDMSHGNYRVIFKIIGIYMGPHGATDQLGSLQVRIIQMQCNVLFLHVILIYSFLFERELLLLLLLFNGSCCQTSAIFASGGKFS